MAINETRIENNDIRSIEGVIKLKLPDGSYKFFKSSDEALNYINLNLKENLHLEYVQLPQQIISTGQTQLDKADENWANKLQSDQKVHNQFGAKSWGEFGKDMAIGTAAAIGLPYVLPYAPTILGDLGTVAGVTNFVSPNGLLKTIKAFLDKRPIAGTYSAIGDITDLSFPIFEGYNIYKGIRSTINPSYIINKETNNIKEIPDLFTKSKIILNLDIPEISVISKSKSAPRWTVTPEEANLSDILMNLSKMSAEELEEFFWNNLYNSVDLQHSRGMTGNYDKLRLNFENGMEELRRTTSNDFIKTLEKYHNSITNPKYYDSNFLYDLDKFWNSLNGFEKKY